jgi:hypothetical protein
MNHFKNQLLFAATLFRDFSVTNWLTASIFRNPGFFIDMGLHVMSGSRLETFAVVRFLETFPARE